MEKLRPQTENLKKPGKEKILEVGFGKEPIFLSSAESTEIIPNNSLYIGIEMNKADIEKAKETTEKAKASGTVGLEEYLFIQADGENLPIPDCSVDKIIFRNIFGAPGRFFKHYRKIKPEQWETSNLRQIMNYKAEEFPLPMRAFYNLDYLKGTLAYVNDLIEQKEKEGAINDNDLYAIQNAFNLLETERAEQQAKFHFISETKRVLRENGQLVIAEIRSPKWAKNYIDTLTNDPDFQLENYSEAPQDVKKYDSQGIAENENFGTPFVVILRKVKTQEPLT